MPDDANNPASSLALAIVNARVWTGDGRRPWADALLVRGARLEAVGSSAEIRKRAGQATVVDGKGRMVLSDEPDGALAVGEPANLVMVDRMQDGESSPEAGADIVLRIALGRVVVDRDSLAR
jgi:imidazolonepropionase-like amidohydrolase